jgi:lysophospholipase L1-like esterase
LPAGTAHFTPTELPGRRAIRRLKQIGQMVTTAWLVAGVTLLLIAGLEIALLLAFTVKDELGRAGRVDRRVRADTYTETSWVGGLFREERRVRAQWHSYVYWRERPFQGEHINIDADGIRRTTPVAPVSAASGRPLRIFMFGGSTLWGSGAREAFTIPSLLARRLQAAGVAATVVNMGAVGYVSTQEVIGLLLRLQKSDVPDLVIFYDGVNDTYSAFQQQIAGLPHNEFNRVVEFNLARPSHFWRRGQLVLRDVAARLSTVRLLRSLVGGTDQEQQIGVRPPLLEHLASNDDANLPGAVIARYRGSVELVKAWAAHYGFRALFYWQPTIFDKPALTAYERTQRERHAEMAPFFRETYDTLRRAPPPGMDVHDLSGIFADVALPMYADWCHLGESGNEAIATRMARDLLQVIAPGSADSPDARGSAGTPGRPRSRLR